MYGILTADADLAKRDIGGVTYYLTEDVRGQKRTPLEGVVNSIACWGDTEVTRADPDRAAVTDEGTRALPTTDGHHWGTVCPTDPAYRRQLLDRLERAGAVGDVRLTTLGYPGDSFCYCDRCNQTFEESEYEDRTEWRTGVITDFVAEATERIEGNVVATLYPDPYPGSLKQRAGLAPETLAAHVDEFLVPLCSEGYETFYWVETLARGFSRELEDLDTSLTFQLSAGGVDRERLVAITRQLEPYGDAIVYGTHQTDSEEITALLQELRADEARAATA